MHKTLNFSNLKTNGNVSFEDLPSERENYNSAQEHLELINLKSLMSEYENKILILEQSELNLKRQNQQLMIEISELKININKYQLTHYENEKKSNEHKESASIMENISLSEAKELIQLLLAEVEDVKSEKKEISERALNLLTEKEIANVELREKLETQRNILYLEINRLANEMSQSQSQSEQEKEKDAKLERRISNKIEFSASEEIVSLKSRIAQLEQENEIFSKKCDDEKFQLVSIIHSQDEVITKLKQQIEETPSYNILHNEKAVNEDNQNENEMIVIENSKLINSLNSLERNFAKKEIEYKEIINRLQDANIEYETQIKHLKSLIAQNELQLKNMEREYKMKISGIYQSTSTEIASKEKEIRALAKKMEDLVRDKSNILTEFEEFKQNSGINKENYIQLQSNLQVIKDNYEKDRKLFEEKLHLVEKKCETEKIALYDQIAGLKARNSFGISPVKRMSSDFKRKTMHFGDFLFPQKDEALSFGMFNHSTNTTLSDCLEDNDTENCPSAVICELEGQLEACEKQISEMKLRINFLSKKEKELDQMKIENSNLKENLQKTKDLYESQMKELQCKNLMMKAGIKGKSANGNPQELNLTESENIIKINNLTIDLEGLRSLLEKERKMYCDEIDRLELEVAQLKLKIAEVSFDKDSEIVKMKNENKKLQKRCEKAIKMKK